jgi:hypothetical protein
LVFKLSQPACRVDAVEHADSKYLSNDQVVTPSLTNVMSRLPLLFCFRTKTGEEKRQLPSVIRE